jgi:hypothetical protein
MPGLESLTTLIIPFATLIAALVAAGASVYNARVGRFISERWWERKADAYNQLVTSLAALVECSDRYHDDALHIRRLSDAESEQWARKWRKADAQVRRATTTAAFLLSDRAREALRQRNMIISSKTSANWFADMERDAEATEQCLREIVDCATEDLRIKRLWPLWNRAKRSRVRNLSTQDAASSGRE